MRALGRRVPGLTLGLAVVAAAAVLAAGPGYRIGWWSLGAAFTLLRYGAELALLTGAIALVAVAVCGATGSGRRLGIGLLALAVALAAFGVPWRLLAQARRVPPIHDITTDLEDPPAFVAVVGHRAGAPNPVEYAGPAVAAQQRAGYPDLGPLDFAVPPERVFPAVDAAARGFGWEIVAAIPAEGRLEATATTPWFGFKDDVVVRIRAHNGGSRVDVRSLSRIGGSDLGTNARRVRAFLDRLRASGLPPA
jgi:uncharacterized protein (DUF1499 family)